MKRIVLALIVLLLAVPTAWAHFIWIVPDKDGKSVQVIFSDSLTPDDPKLLAKIEKFKPFVRHADGEAAALDIDKTKEAFRLTVPGKGPRLVGLTHPYGVIQRGNAEPFLLNYYASAIAGSSAYDAPDSLRKAWDKLPLQIVRVPALKLTFEVLWQGKPLADAEVSVLAPGKDKAIDTKSNAQGRVELETVDPGLCGIRTRHVEKKEGKHDGKEYKEIRHYATFVMEAQASAAPKEDPAASKLLQEARAARARWDKFPGFTADVEVNFNGKTSKGKAIVEANGKVLLDGIDKEMEPWARRNLASTVGHRLDESATRNTPCAFIDDNKDHPLGCAIRVLNDELHSSYRIRDKQIMEVNRQTKEGKFTISVLENRPNAEGKFLSAAFVVNYWNAESGDLQRSEAHHQTWTRVGKFDLPVTTTVVTGAGEKSAAGNGKMAQSLTLTNHKLAEGAGK
jgi:hypothetical protein